MLNTRISSTLGTMTASSVTSLDVERLRDQLAADGYAKSSVLGALATISKMYTWGRRQRYVDVENPAKGVERPRPLPSIDYLSKIEAADLLSRAELHFAPFVPLVAVPHLWPMVATALFAGLRKGELFGLRWPDVHLDTHQIDVMRSYELLPKSGKPRHVPMHPSLRASCAPGATARWPVKRILCSRSTARWGAGAIPVGLRTCCARPAATSRRSPGTRYGTRSPLTS